MSDDVLKLIPADPDFVPPVAAQLAAREALEQHFPDGGEGEVQDYGHVTYIDQGENLEAVLCRACGTRLPLHGSAAAERNMDWWYASFDAIAGEDFAGVTAAMPCCGKSVPLTSLQFDWPGGFARFELCIWNPGVAENLAPEEVAKFEAILGCKLLQVRAHY